MPGIKDRELMHEWIKADAVIYDLPTEEIIQQLCLDNEFLTEFIKRHGLEYEMRIEVNK